MAPNPIRFALALHNHQPVGNFDWTIEDAYRQSYLPFLERFSQSRYEKLKISLHHSGCLEEWLEEHHPEYLDRLAELVQAGRVEILGGPFQEPILAMLSSRDRKGQIRMHTQWLKKRLGAEIRGMWMPERVWEQSFVEDLAAAGIEYTIVDDYHFKKSGLEEEELFGYYVTEDAGRVMAVFPGSEKLRYWIPFHEPSETMEYFRKIRENHANPILVFGDDGEKFGTWPGTYQHVYENGWLERFLEALLENSDWIQTVTLSEARDGVAPLGKRYLPDCSYREMTEWSLPVQRLVEYDQAVHQIDSEQEPWKALRTFLSGGNWRNFKNKYPETNEMYARMMTLSERVGFLEEFLAEDATHPQWHKSLEEIRCLLYRGQCNCSYWHGAFGGVYLPHLRNAVYQNLIAADNLLEELESEISGQYRSPLTIHRKDFNFDLLEEIRLADKNIIAWLAPHQGGMLYELDFRPLRHNVLATLARRPEAYHQKILNHQEAGEDSFASIHERVVFKQEGLKNRLQYDPILQKSLQDLFFPVETTLEKLYQGEVQPWFHFAQQPYTASVEEENGSVTLSRTGTAISLQGNSHEIGISKTFSLLPEGGYAVRYRLHLPAEETFHFAVQMNFAGMPGQCDDRYFYDAEHLRQGNLSTRLDWTDVSFLGLADEWLKLDVAIQSSRPTNFWTYPVETVSNSEGGFEAVHQSVGVLSHWQISGAWEVRLEVKIRRLP